MTVRKIDLDSGAKERERQTDRVRDRERQREKVTVKSERDTQGKKEIRTDINVEK